MKTTRPKPSGLQWKRLVALALSALAIAGCRIELHSALDETDANEMIAVLARQDIDANKRAVRGGAFAVRIANGDVAEAVEVLARHGLPRKRYHSMGEVFRKKGLISSPLEERARLVYALQENLQETLSQIDGVMVARVHVVVPETNPFADEADKASSASVLIKHAADHDLDSLRSEIKRLVGNSIQGLTYRDVTVSLVPAQHSVVSARDVLAAPEPESSSTGWAVAAAISVGLMLIAAWLTRAFLRSESRRQADISSEAAA